MSIVKKRFLSLIIGIILLLISLLMNKINLLRAILCITSIILLTYSNQLERTHKKVFIPLFVILFFFFVTSLDYLNVTMFKKLPILTYSIIKSDSGTVYNALGYRVWSCNDGNIKVDPLYKLGYYCKESNISSENINNVLTTIYDNYEDYKDSYVSVIGRVSNVIDNKSFTMQMFREDNEKIKFDERYTLYVEFNYENKEIASLNENSLVVVLGKINKKEGNNIYMVDAKLTKEKTEESQSLNISASSNTYCQYDKELWFQTTDNNFYKSCIDDVNITIGDRQYNLVNAIKNNLITLDELKEESLGYQKQSIDNSMIYNYKDFKILVCDPSTSIDVIIGKTSMDFSDGYCKVSNDDRGV